MYGFCVDAHVSVLQAAQEPDELHLALDGAYCAHWNDDPGKGKMDENGALKYIRIIMINIYNPIAHWNEDLPFAFIPLVIHFSIQA